MIDVSMVTVCPVRGSRIVMEMPLSGLTRKRLAPAWVAFESNRAFRMVNASGPGTKKGPAV